MTTCLKRPSEFPGIGIKYDMTAQPFFQAIVLEKLRMIKSCTTGALLLDRIKNAKPGSVPADWPRLVNVLIQPPLEKKMSAPGLKNSFTESGEKSFSIGKQDVYDDWYTGKKGKLMPSMNAKTAAQELDSKAAATTADGKGAGTVAWLYFSNIEIITKSGEWLPDHITMAHELIHCLHYLEGDSSPDYKNEEYYTVGIKGFEDEEITENKLRSELKFPQRKKYFADD